MIFFSALDALEDINIDPGKDGRPMEYQTLLQLARWLEGIAAECGGTASIKDAKGRLIDALNILRDALPGDIIPDELPYSSLERTKKIEHSRIRQQVDRRKTLKTGEL
ncbi:hypothetical protein QW131_14365 [Roseibium salinum]|nr:hypothetical protein [Roseibium salinum]